MVQHRRGRHPRRRSPLSWSWQLLLDYPPVSVPAAGDAGDVFLPNLRKCEMDQDKGTRSTYRKGYKPSPASPASPAPRLVTRVKGSPFTRAQGPYIPSPKPTSG